VSGSEFASESGSESGSVTHSATSRALRADSTFGDIARVARELDQAGAGSSNASCLLRTSSSPSLEADLMLAISPLPNPWNDFTRFNEAHGAIRVLTRWGQAGPEIYDAAIAAFTATPPVALDAAAAVVFLADDRAYVRLSSGAVSDAHKRSVALGTLTQAVRAVAPSNLAVVYLTATASTSLAHIHAALEQLGALEISVAFAVPLAPDTHLPARLVDASSEPAGDLCTNGIDVEESAPEGDLPPSGIQSVLRSAQPSLTACFTDNAREAAGGARYAVQLLVDARGHVERACVRQENVRDRALRSCVLNAVRALVFQAPQPSGSVLLELPFAFQATAASMSAPLCGDH
jgi:hypothetical protein